MAKSAMWSWLLGAVLCLGVWPQSWAADPALEACIVKAAAYRQIDPLLLKAICTQESGCNRAIIHPKNKNGSVDIGAFGINDGGLPKLKKKGITRAQLTDGSCTDAYVAAWFLADAISRFGPTWRAVGAYNSPTESNRAIYAAYVRSHYIRLLAGQR
jgi:soluble lytic murein transglycosylase-like protein